MREGRLLVMFDGIPRISRRHGAPNTAVSLIHNMMHSIYDAGYPGNGRSSSPQGNIAGTLV